MRVLVTDGDNRAALAIVRSLGRAGNWVVVGSLRSWSLAQASRYCGHAFAYPDPVHDEAGFIAALKRAVEELQIDVLLPVTDITTTLVMRHRASFPSGCRIPFADAPVIERAANKVEVLEAALQLGVPVPRTVVKQRGESVADHGLPYPVVIKPARSRVRTAAGWIACSVGYATNERDLEAKLAARHPEEFPIALQERISGPGVGVFLCYEDGHIVAQFAHRRVREKPPSGGVSVLCESVPVCPEALRYARALLDHLGWRGVAMVEFKRDERDGAAKLMEINGRFWGSLQLAIDSGVDFPKILLDCVAGRAPATPPAYAYGVRSRWFWGHVDSMMVELLRRDVNANGDRLAALADFCRLWGRDLHYENPRWGDLRPWLYETRLWLRGIR